MRGGSGLNTGAGWFVRADGVCAGEVSSEHRWRFVMLLCGFGERVWCVRVRVLGRVRFVPWH